MSGYQCVNQTGCSDHTKPHGCGLGGCKDRDNDLKDQLSKTKIAAAYWRIVAEGTDKRNKELQEELKEVNKALGIALKALEELHKEALGL
jgi:hypothetical protein